MPCTSGFGSCACYGDRNGGGGGGLQPGELWFVLFTWQFKYYHGARFVAHLGTNSDGSPNDVEGEEGPFYVVKAPTILAGGGGRALTNFATYPAGTLYPPYGPFVSRDGNQWPTDYSGQVDAGGTVVYPDLSLISFDPGFLSGDLRVSRIGSVGGAGPTGRAGTARISVSGGPAGPKLRVEGAGNPFKLPLNGQLEAHINTIGELSATFSVSDWTDGQTDAFDGRSDFTLTARIGFQPD